MHLCDGGRQASAYVRPLSDGGMKLPLGQQVIAEVYLNGKWNSRQVQPPMLFSHRFLGRFSPKFRPFYAIFRPFSPSWRQEAGDRERTAKRRRKTGEKWPRTSGLKALGYTVKILLYRQMELSRQVQLTPVEMRRWSQAAVERWVGG